MERKVHCLIEFHLFFKRSGDVLFLSLEYMQFALRLRRHTATAGSSKTAKRNRLGASNLSNVMIKCNQNT